MCFDALKLLKRYIQMTQEIKQAFQTRLSNLKQILEIAKQTNNYPLKSETKQEITIIKHALQTTNEELKNLFDMMNSYIV